MIKFIKNDNRLILSYTGETRESNWIYSEISPSKSITLKKTFSLGQTELLSEEDTDDSNAPVLFEIGRLVNSYYMLSKDVFKTDNFINLHFDLDITIKIFIAERNISIMSKLDKLVSKDIYIGGFKDNAIPERSFEKLINRFPTYYELTRYASARIDSLISSFVELKHEYEERYLKYMNSRQKDNIENTVQLVASAEVGKYELLFSKLKEMLTSEDAYSEYQWQKEIIQIILILYPQYIYVCEEAPVQDSEKNKKRRIDFLLIDSNGNIDIVEIKKPFDKCIVTDKTYRDNFIPLRELSGTVMQIEKYIFYLNRWGKQGEEKLSQYCKDKIGEDVSIKITNPNAIIIMGRENELSADQKRDFEVIKRKYKNVIDIISYDDLLSRLQAMLNHWRKEHNKCL